MPNYIQLCHTVKQEDSYGQSLVTWSIRRGVRKADYNYWITSCCGFPNLTQDSLQRPVVPPCCPLRWVGTAVLSSSLLFSRQQKPRVCWSTWGWHQGGGQQPQLPGVLSPSGKREQEKGTEEACTPGWGGKTQQYLLQSLWTSKDDCPHGHPQESEPHWGGGHSEASVTRFLPQCYALLFRYFWGITMGCPDPYVFSFLAQT